MALAFIGVRAENVTMMTDVFGNERFPLWRKRHADFCAMSANRGMNGKPLGKTMRFLPDGEMGWLNINGDAGSGQWHTVWFTRRRVRR